MDKEYKSGGKKHKKCYQFDAGKEGYNGFNCHAEGAVAPDVRMFDAGMIDNGGHRKHGKNERKNNESRKNG